MIFLPGDRFTTNSELLDERSRFEQFLKERMRQYLQQPVPAGDEHGADQPEMASLHDFEMTVDPYLGIVPVERLRQTYLNQGQLKHNQQSKSSNALQWSEVPSDIGGRTRAVMWDPNDPEKKKVWAGGVTGGLWYRENISSNLSGWQPVDDFWSCLNVSCIAFDPVNPMIFYVGTGEAQTAMITYRESSGTGTGIWKSTDGGINWSLIENTLGFEYITDIVVREENGTGVVYAGVASGVYKGNTHFSDPSDGLFRSADGGGSWEQVLPDIPGHDDPYAVSDIDMGADGRIYVGTMPNINTLGGATVLYTDDGTPGSWTVYGNYVSIIQNQPQYNIPGRVVVAAAPTNEDVVYAAISAGTDEGFIAYRCRYILKSSNKGQTWSQRNIPEDDYAKIAWHSLLLAVDPNNSTDIFTGGKDLWFSTNSGAGWDRISDWTKLYTGGGDNYVHCDQHLMVFKPGSSSIFMVSTDGGVFYTTTGNNTQPVFLEKNQGFNTLQFYTCDIQPLSGSLNFMGGLQDNGTLHFQNDPLSINDIIDNGDGSFCGFDENEPNLWITSVYYNQYTVFLNGSPFKYLDYDNGIFINPADYDSRNNILYANAVDFFGGTPNTLLRVKGIPYNPVEQYLSLPTGTNVYFSVVKVSPWAPVGVTNLFLGTQTGRVYKVTNAQASPQVIEITGDQFPFAYVSCIAVGQTEQDVLVTFSNYGVKSVWITHDGGLTWINAEGDLPDIPVRYALFHPENNEQVLVATELGVWSTIGIDDAEVLWTPETEGFANVRTDMLKLRASDNTLLAATHGRGLFYTQYEANSTVMVPENFNDRIQVFPNPASDLVTVTCPVSAGQKFVLQLFNCEGFRMSETTSEFCTSIHPSLKINVSGYPAGIYFISISAGEKHYFEKLMIP